jgi:hypothetical protein
VLNTTFNYLEEEYLVYCNYKYNSLYYSKIFYKGAINTIIKLLYYIRDSLYTRVISIDLVKQLSILLA